MRKVKVKDVGAQEWEKETEDSGATEDKGRIEVIEEGEKM